MSTSSYSQQKRLLSLSTPLGHDVFLLTKLMGNEGLTQESLFTLDVLSENQALDDTTLLGQSVNMDIEQHDGSFRVFNGIVDRIQARGIVDKYLRRYTFHIVSPISLMKKTTDVRHFLDATLLSTIEHMLNKHKLNYTLNIQHPQRTDEFIVQYNETDYDFTHRLLQEAGINYRIEHKTGEQTLVLFDSPGGYINSPAPEHEYRDGDIDRPHYFNWHKRTEFPTARTSQRSFDFLRPYTPVKSHTDTLLSAPLSTGFETYTYPGLPVIEAYADRDSERQMEQLESQHEQLSVQSTVRSLAPGQRIRFSGTHPLPDEQGQAYIVTHTRYTAVDDTYLNQKESTQDCQTSINAMPDTRHYHPPLRYNRPSVEGSQTALVTGPPGEEIYTDEHGRIKVQFHWDRLSKRNQDSSCWIRVMQSLAGDGWGTQFIPRIGDEVLVHFIDGDINKPVVTGGVYNGKNNPPYGLPGNKTQMGIKSRSSKGASQNHANEIRFEDKKDSEDLFIQAQRDQTTLIKSNHSRTVGNDQSLSVGGNKSEVVNESRSTIISEGSDSLQVEKDLGILSVTGYTILDGHDSIELRTGSASLSMDKSGNITLYGTSIHIDGDNAVNINAGASATAPAPQIPKFDNIYTTPASVSAAVRMLPMSLAKPPVVDDVAKNNLSRAKLVKTAFAPEDILHTADLDYKMVNNEPVKEAPYRFTESTGAVRSGILDANGQAHIAGIQPGPVKVEYFPEKTDADLIAARTALKSALSNIIDAEKVESAALQAQQDKMSPFENYQHHKKVGILAALNAGKELAITADNWYKAGAPKHIAERGLGAALEATWGDWQGDYSQPFKDRFINTFTEAQKKQTIKALGFDPTVITSEHIADAFEVMNYIYDDPESKKIILKFLADYTLAQDSTEYVELASGFAFEVALGAIVTYATAGAGAAVFATSAAKLMKNLGELLGPLGKALMTVVEELKIWKLKKSGNGSSNSKIVSDGDIPEGVNIGGAAENPRIKDYKKNKNGVKRTPEEAIAMARAMGIEIPDDINFGFMDNWTRTDANAEYFQHGTRLKPDDWIEWEDFYHERTGKIPVRFNEDLLNSDEALMAHISHEMHELNALRDIFDTEGALQAKKLNELINIRDNGGHANNLHEQAWDVADDIVNSMRK